MKKNFFRKVAFGLSPNEKINEDPLNWAKQQFDTDFEKIKREVFWEQNIKNYSENLFKA